MQKALNFAVLVFLGTLAGCGAFVEVVKVDSEENASAINTVQILNREQLRGKKVEIVQTISANSCKNKLWDPDPTRDNAIAQLKVKAARIGANTVTNLYCGDQTGTNLGTNCWSSIECSAAAVIATD